MRAAYRRKGWAFTDPQQIDQCAKEGYITKLKEQEGEGCNMWGTLNVNKVTVRKAHWYLDDLLLAVRQPFNHQSSSSRMRLCSVQIF